MRNSASCNSVGTREQFGRRLLWIPRDGSAGLGVCGCFCAPSRAPNVMPLEPDCISSPPPAAVWLAAERLVPAFLLERGAARHSSLELRIAAARPSPRLWGIRECRHWTSRCRHPGTAALRCGVGGRFPSGDCEGQGAQPSCNKGPL